ncbi:hypothetical protein PGTUg99_004651 [Puccinia graminis f. sp. tritici]|uniref:Uncharacterized protein n=1 Tax=Puccinia graminis f. sp. tritici TaxID=56615 RepID=A0A5B0PFM8_PUCGR|nr:hypothetical protein PGTUg99_004651 [Puccinia graminis f. sp. tritici]
MITNSNEVTLSAVGAACSVSNSYSTAVVAATSPNYFILPSCPVSDGYVAVCESAVVWSTVFAGKLPGFAKGCLSGGALSPS